MRVRESHEPSVSVARPTPILCRTHSIAHSARIGTDECLRLADTETTAGSDTGFVRDPQGTLNSMARNRKAYCYLYPYIGHRVRGPMGTSGAAEARAEKALGQSFALAVLLNLADAVWNPWSSLWTAARIGASTLFTIALVAYLVLWISRKRRTASDSSTAGGD